MKNKFMIVITCILLVISMLPLSAFAVNSEDIVILYENDVHCTVEGYSKLSAMKKELQETHSYVGVVSGGDFIQGNSLGVISKGEYIVNLMNLVGYDAVTLGNHEFDYRLDRLNVLVDMMDTKPVCCNFQKTGAALHISGTSPNIYKVMKLAGIEKLAKLERGNENDSK